MSNSSHIKIIECEGELKCCATFHSILQLLRTKRSCSDNYRYTKHIIESPNENVQLIYRETILTPSSKNVSLDRIPLVFSIPPFNFPVILQNSEALQTSNDKPNTSCKREHNLSNHLVCASYPQPSFFLTLALIRVHPDIILPANLLPIAHQHA